MPIKSYILHYEEEKKEALLEKLQKRSNCEVFPAQNHDVIVIVTSSPVAALLRITEGASGTYITRQFPWDEPKEDPVNRKITVMKKVDGGGDGYRLSHGQRKWNCFATRMQVRQLTKNNVIKGILDR